ncbi:MAG: phosphoenolpyruvate carboxykinase (ATP) [Planctomycetota bacterium]|jgi:phosphoenolpyruvate carboxykinase (ATP)
MFNGVHSRLRFVSLFRYELLTQDTHVWLINTGGSDCVYSTGSRIKLPNTRSLLDVIHSGRLTHDPAESESFFGLDVVTSRSGAPTEVPVPRHMSRDPKAYNTTASKLAGLFRNSSHARL